MTRSPSGPRSMSFANRAPGDRAGGGADHLAGDRRVGRSGDLPRRLGDRGHADDELPRLLLAHLELLGASLVLGRPLAQLAHERLDREADDRRHADPEERRASTRWADTRATRRAEAASGRPRRRRRCSRRAAAACRRARARRRAASTSTPYEELAAAVGLAEQGDDDEVGEGRHDLREVRQEVPRHQQIAAIRISALRAAAASSADRNPSPCGGRGKTMIASAIAPRNGAAREKRPGRSNAWNLDWSSIGCAAGLEAAVVMRNATDRPFGASARYSNEGRRP